VKHIGYLINRLRAWKYSVNQIANAIEVHPSTVYKYDDDPKRSPQVSDRYKTRLLADMPDRRFKPAKMSGRKAR
jgi:IS30 family transposase